MKDDTISRRAAIDAISCDITVTGRQNAELVAQTIGRFADRIKALPSAQPDEEKISDILYNIYRNTSPHTSAEGVAAIKYYIREIYREIYGEEGPKWLKK